MNRTPSNRTTASILAVAALVVGVQTACAYERIARTSTPHYEVDGNLVDVQIQVDGASAPFYFKPGTWNRHYFQAFKGRNYSVVVRNNSARRVGVLIAVDGLNVVNGEITRRAHDEPMYVLGPYERAVIRGWRTSLDDIRRFVFVDEHRSYAERSGKATGDLGWIRVLAFRESEPWPRLKLFNDRPRPTEDELGANEGRDDSNAPTPPPTAGREEPRAQAQKESQGDTRGPAAANPGTGWGEHRNDPVREVDFQPVNRPTDHLVMRYEYASGLQALGIYPRGDRTWERERGELGFAQPPRR